MLIPYPLLSPKEQEHFNLILDGLSQQEISERMSVSKETIKTRVKSILFKFNKQNTTILICDYYKSIIEDLKGENNERV